MGWGAPPHSLVSHGKPASTSASSAAAPFQVLAAWGLWGGLGILTRLVPASYCPYHLATGTPGLGTARQRACLLPALPRAAQQLELSVSLSSSLGRAAVGFFCLPSVKDK